VFSVGLILRANVDFILYFCPLSVDSVSQDSSQGKLRSFYCRVMHMHRSEKCCTQNVYHGVHTYTLTQMRCPHEQLLWATVCLGSVFFIFNVFFNHGWFACDRVSFYMSLYIFLHFWCIHLAVVSVVVSTSH